MRHSCIALVLAAVALAGCGGGGDSTAKKTGQKIGEGVGDLVSGVSKGLDDRMTVKVVLSDPLKAAGVTTTVAKVILDDPAKSKSISVYFIAAKPLAGNFVARAVNAGGQEIGRAKAPVAFRAGDAEYVQFDFDERLDRALVDHYEIGFVPQDEKPG